MNNEQQANQAVFDAAWDRIIAQDGPPMEAGTCVYESSDGAKCAFAPAIQHYDPIMEGESASGLLNDYSANLFPWARMCSYELADEIQAAHDNEAASGIDIYTKPDFIGRFKTAMRDVAKQYGLTVPEEDHAPE